MVADSAASLRIGNLCIGTPFNCTSRTFLSRTYSSSSGRQTSFLGAFVIAMLLLVTTANCAQLEVLPSKLELTGLDPIHGVVVSLTDDQGAVTDVSHRVTFQLDKPELVSVDQRGVLQAHADGEAV
ncbi:MAG: hypothetical protein RL240_1973, partial [Planctomycetota bacterium]